MTGFTEDFDWQRRFIPHFEEIALNVVRIRVASWEDDARRNTDLVATLENGHRIACRVRRVDYATRYGREFTVRLDRPSGVPSEMRKLRDGWGDFGIYGFEAAPESVRLRPWVLYNAHLLRGYLDAGGRWTEQDNHDGSSRFAAFAIDELPLGCVLNSEGHPSSLFDPMPPGPCRFCGRPCWTSDESGPAHACCIEWDRMEPGRPCEACRTSDALCHRRYGWPA